MRRANKIATIDAVQVEYSPWEPEIEHESGTFLKATCNELGITVVCYSPLGRGFLTGQIKSPDDLETGDVRSTIPRFSRENFYKNAEFTEALKAIAARRGCTASQLCLAWLIAQGDNFVPIPGTKKIKYLEENVAAAKIVLSKEEEQEIRAEVEKADIVGSRGRGASSHTGLMDTPELP